MQDKGAFRKKLADAIAHGLTKDEALAALTTVPARQLGVDARSGTIEAGKLANIVIDRKILADLALNDPAAFAAVVKAAQAGQAS